MKTEVTRSLVKLAERLSLLLKTLKLISTCILGKKSTPADSAAKRFSNTLNCVNMSGSTLEKSRTSVTPAGALSPLRLISKLTKLCTPTQGQTCAATVEKHTKAKRR